MVPSIEDGVLSAHHALLFTALQSVGNLHNFDEGYFGGNRVMSSSAYG